MEQQTTRTAEAAPEDRGEEVGLVRRIMNRLSVTAADVAADDQPPNTAAEDVAEGIRSNAPEGWSAERHGNTVTLTSEDASAHAHPLPATNTANHTHPTPGAVPGGQASDAASAGEETEEDMDSGATATAVQTTEESDVTEANGQEVTRQEFERLETELAQERARSAASAAVIRSRGIDALLRREGAVTLENGRRGVMPPAQRTAAKTLIGQLAAAGDEHDPIELSADGEASLRDNPGGQAVRSLLTPWKPQEVGERGTVEGEPRAEGAEGDHERVMAELEKRGLGMEHYGTVAGQLTASGQIRRGSLSGPGHEGEE